MNDRSSIHRHYLEAEQTRHKVGAEQNETEEERKDAASKGKATTMHIGTKAMKARMNIQMLIQCPLKMEPRRELLWGSSTSSYSFGGMAMGGGMYPAGGMGGGMSSMSYGMASPSSVSAYSFGGGMKESFPMSAASLGKKVEHGSSEEEEEEEEEEFVTKSKMKKSGRRGGGTSSVARVSKGSLYDSNWKGVAKPIFKRHDDQRATVTVTVYYAVVGGVPSEEDVKAAIDDLNALYASCRKESTLSDAMELTAPPPPAVASLLKSPWDAPPTYTESTAR